MLRLLACAPIPQLNHDSGRLLIIKPDHLGDVLLATPAIQAIKSWRPQTSIHVLCGPWSADALAPYPEIDQVLTLPFPGFQRSAAEAANPWLVALRSARRLRCIGYEAAIIMRPDHWWGAAISYLAGIQLRVGYDMPGVAPFLTRAYTLRPQHAVAQNLRLVSAWTGELADAGIRLTYPVQPLDRQHITKRMADWGLGAGRRLICLHPGSGAPSKLWRADKWARVADSLACDYDATIVFTGGASELTLIEEIRTLMRSADYRIAGSTSVGQLAALYKRASAVLGPDSGALHLAAAVHTPTVALFGPADPVEFAPWGDPDRHVVVNKDIGCCPCRILDWSDDDPKFHPCVRDISVSQVLAAARRVLQSADAGL